MSWKWVGIALLILFAAAGVAYGVKRVLTPWRKAQDLGREHPYLSKVPEPLPDTSLATLKGMRVIRFGFSFQTPWKEIGREESMPGLSALGFKGGATMMVFDPSGAVNAAELARGDATMDTLVDQDTLRSNYALTAAAMAVTPDRVKWWETPGENARNSFLLAVKMGHVHDSEPLYTIGAGELRGFQEGSPTLAPYKVKLDLFDGADRHYEIWISGKDGPVVSQTEVNAMVASFRPIPHS